MKKVYTKGNEFEKPCKECGEVLPRTDEYFYKAATTFDGLQAKCKRCTKKAARAKTEMEKADRAKYKREYRRANPEIQRMHAHRRRTRKLNANGDHNHDDIRNLYDEQCGRCGYCGITLHDEYHVDHITPLSRDGSNSPKNLLIACPSCNLSKNDFLLTEWQQVRGW